VNQILDDPYGDDSINPVNGGRRFLNPAAFAQPALGTLGTMRRNSVRSVGTKNLDLALTRRIATGGSREVEFRMEAFNALNWFQWGQPNTNLFSATFGQITTAGAPRILQLAVKYAF